MTTDRSSLESVYRYDILSVYLLTKVADVIDFDVFTLLRCLRYFEVRKQGHCMILGELTYLPILCCYFFLPRNNSVGYAVAAIFVCITSICSMSLLYRKCMQITLY